MTDILLDYIQMNASGFIKGNRVGSLEQVIMDFYWRWQRSPNAETFKLLKADVEKVKDVIDQEILELFGIEKE